MTSSLPAWSAEPAEAVRPPAKATASGEGEARTYFTDLELVTQNGEAVRFYSDVLKDRVVLINFVFTRCQDACPMLVHKLLKVKELLGEKLGETVYFVSISIDPERDTPEDMKAFAEQQKAQMNGWIFLTGTPDNVNHIVKKLGQYSPDVEAHSTLLLAGNVRTRHWMKIPPNIPPGGIAEKLRLLADDELAAGP
jgi:cytochrome oxidase Cu insertion factor (SCO1/SenC/PrrC family)